MSYTRARLAYRHASLGRGVRARAGSRGRVPVHCAGGPASRAQAVAAGLGLALIFAAFASGLQPLAVHTFLWAHLLQNVVLAEWAPALLVLAVPPRVAARAAGFPLFRPFVALPLWLGTYFVWHLPWIYDNALQRPHSLLHVEHLTYLLAGICLWWPVVPRRVLRRTEGGLSLRGVRARIAARAAARADSAADLLVLRARAAHVGAGAARRPADRRRDDGGRGGDRLLHRLHRVPVAFLREEQADGAFDRGVADGRTRRGVARTRSRRRRRGRPRDGSAAAARGPRIARAGGRADPGAAWRERYDRLRLHTPRLLSGLPGREIPRRYGRWVRRDDVSEPPALATGSCSRRRSSPCRRLARSPRMRGSRPT